MAERTGHPFFIAPQICRGILIPAAGGQAVCMLLLLKVSGDRLLQKLKAIQLTMVEKYPDHSQPLHILSGLYPYCGTFCPNLHDVAIFWSYIEIRQWCRDINSGDARYPGISAVYHDCLYIC